VSEADLAQGDQGGPDFVFDEGTAVVFEEDVAPEVGEVDGACFGVGHAGIDEGGEELRCEEVPQFVWVEWTASHFWYVFVMRGDSVVRIWWFDEEELNACLRGAIPSCWRTGKTSKMMPVLSA